MPALSKVELYAAIRRDSRAGMSSRAIEHQVRCRPEHGPQGAGVGVAGAEEEVAGPRSSKLDPFKPAIDEILRADLDAPRKQRHTVTPDLDRLIDEHGMAGISYQVVRAYVAGRRPEILAEAGRGPDSAFVPQTHQPGCRGRGRLR